MTSVEALALLHARSLMRSWNQATAGDWANVLATFPLFAGISKRRLRKLVRQATFAEFAPGETIIFAGDPANSLYVILGGHAKARATSSGRTLGAGDYFGEASLIDGRAESATVVTMSDLHAMRLPARSILMLARRDPALAVTLLRDLATRFRDLEITLVRDGLEQRLLRNPR